jgi:hypothetical protein
MFCDGGLFYLSKYALKKAARVGQPMSLVEETFARAKGLDGIL